MERSFRSAMFGFNKEDVAKFIYQQSKSFEKQLSEKDAEIDRIRALLDEAEEKKENWIANEQAAEAIMTEAASLEASSKACLEAISSQKETFDAWENHCRLLEEYCGKLEAFREKAQKFDSLTVALSGVFGPERPLDAKEDGLKDDAGAMPEKPNERINWEDESRLVSDLVKTSEKILSLLKEMRY